MIVSELWDAVTDYSGEGDAKSSRDPKPTRIEEDCVKYRFVLSFTVPTTDYFFIILA